MMVDKKVDQARACGDTADEEAVEEAVVTGVSAFFPESFL